MKTEQEIRERWNQLSSLYPEFEFPYIEVAMTELKWVLGDES